jgi:hypothetical protein
MVTFQNNFPTALWTCTRMLFHQRSIHRLATDRFVGLTLLTEVLARCSDKLNKQSSMNYRSLYHRAHF